MLTVWSLCWGDKYSDYAVQRLQWSVQEHLPRKHRFVCITDRNIQDVKCIRPVVDWPGWWGKVSLFKPGFADRLNLWLDLDVVVTGSLDPIVDCLDEHSLAMPTNWAQSGHGGCQSSVMVWRDCEMTQQIYDLFDPAWIHWPPKQPWKFYGDQEVITHFRDTGLIRVRPIPEQYVRSFKYHCRQGLPEDCRVAVFHGQPKPSEVKASWFQW